MPKRSQALRTQLLRSAGALVASTALLLGTVIANVLPAVGSQAHAATPALPAGRVSAWLPYWDQARALESFMANADLYSAASPFWYQLSGSGVVSKYPGAEDGSVLEAVRGKGVKVVPTITNDFDPVRASTMLASESSRAAHVNALVSLVTSNGFDGLDVDYESLAAADRDRYSAFLRSLSSELHAQGKLLTVAVHPKTAEPGTWSGPQAQDYAAIGAVADRVRVMTYDYSWATSPAGPIAPVSWMRQVAAFATSVIPAAKVELGVNLYGYDWVESKAEGVMHDQVSAQLNTSGAARVWDSTAAEPHYSYTADGTSHTVYYADAQSVGARLGIVDDYGLAGVAFWRLGGEDPAVWNTIRNTWPATLEAPADSVVPQVLNLTSRYVGTTRPRFALRWAFGDASPSSGLSVFEGILRNHTTGASSSFTTTMGTRTVYALPGNAYTMAVRTRDSAGNLSSYAVTRFVAPRDDRSFSSSGLNRLTGTADYMGSRLASNKAGSYARFSFKGKTATVGVVKSVNSGYVDVFVDGVRTSRVSLYRSIAAYRQPLRVASFSTVGAHTVVLKVVGARQAGATGTWVQLDSLTIA